MSPDKQALDELRIDRGTNPGTKTPVVLLLFVVLILAAGAGLFIWHNRTDSPAVRTLVVRQPAGGEGLTLLNASGYVTARREATVSSKVTGKVVEIKVEEGMKVEAGQALARLDSSNVEKSLQLAEAQLQSTRKGLDETRAVLEQSEREWLRFSQLAQQQVASQSELDRADSEVKSLKARLERQQADISVAEREVALWRQQLDDTIIRAPFTGIVTSKNAQPGEMISPMSAGGFTRTGICTIVDMASLEIEVDVNESYIHRVKEGQPVEATLDSYPDWRIPAEVIAIIPTADRQKATVKVRVGFEQLDPRILPEMGVKVAFQRAGPAPAVSRDVVVPPEAVHRQDDRDIVWLVRDGRVERRAVTVGSPVADGVSLAAGVNPGDRVVVEGADNLVDGARVTETKQ
jgi:RND family efflux transporter MFP subunit